MITQDFCHTLVVYISQQLFSQVKMILTINTVAALVYEEITDRTSEFTSCAFT